MVIVETVVRIIKPSQSFFSGPVQMWTSLLAEFLIPSTQKPRSWITLGTILLSQMMKNDRKHTICV